MIRLGFIGCGDMGSGHMAGFQAIAGCVPVAAADTSSESIQRCSGMIPGLVTYSDYRELLARQDIDAVVISVPNFLHREAAVLSLKAGKHVFLEKPIAQNIEDCDAIIREHHDSGLILQVGLVYRYSNLYKSVAQISETGQMGEISMVYCREHRENFPMPWFFNPEESGGALVDKNCHHFDLFNWFIRSRPIRVFASGGQHVVKGDEYTIKCSYSRKPGLIIKTPGIVDHANVVVEYENGAVGSLSLCMYEKEPIQGLEIGVIGSNGTHLVVQRDVMLTAGGGTLEEDHEIPVDYYSDNEDLGHLGCQVVRKEFIRCIESGIEPYCNLRTARECLVVSFAAERSIIEKRVVEISEYDFPEMRDILESYPDPMTLETPDPLPAPRLYDSVKAPPEKLSFLQYVLTLLKLSFPGRQTKGTFKEFSDKFMNRLALVMNTDRQYKELSQGLTVSIVFSYPEKKDLIVNINNGTIYVSEAPVNTPVKVSFTEIGWRGFLEGESLNRLSLKREISVSGDYKNLVPYVNALLLIGETAKKI